MFEDEPSVFPSRQYSNSSTQVPHYPTQNIQIPIAIFYGGKGL